MSDRSLETPERFSICEQIGSGGMAVVHRAIETLPNGEERVVALKRLHGTYADNKIFVDTFVREARITQLLDHPSIVQTYGHGPLPGSHFISMEFIQGHSLLKALRASKRKPIPIHVVVSLLQDLFTALDYMHSKTHEGEHLRLIHRDVTPANLIVNTEGRLRIIDFGVAKAALAEMQTWGNAVKGKLSYLAPESLKPAVKLDARLDIFSAGIVAHELISGRPLFGRKGSRAKTIQSLLTQTIEPPSVFNPDCPPALDTLILEMLERDRDARLGTAGAALPRLKDIARSLDTRATHRQVAIWCESTFGPVDHTARSARPEEAPVPEYDSYEIASLRRPKNRFPSDALTTQGMLADTGPRPPHLRLSSQGVRRRPGNRFPTDSVTTQEILVGNEPIGSKAPPPSLLSNSLAGRQKQARPPEKPRSASAVVLGDVRVTFYENDAGAVATPLPERVAKGTSAMPSVGPRDHETRDHETPKKDADTQTRAVTHVVQERSFPRLSSQNAVTLALVAVVSAVLGGAVVLALMG